MSLNQESSDLSPDRWPFSLEWLPQPAYLVGGTVRDALIERRREYLDLDFVLPRRAVETARRIAQHYNAGFVLLDKERQIARVVFEGGTADFAQQEGESLEADLRRRDFTINAIAYDPHAQTLSDPLEGCEDLERGAIRMVSKSNLRDDPLRLLRAYRQASQLNFSIKKKTRSTIRFLSPLLKTVAVERVRVELGYLLGGGDGGYWLKEAWQDGLLNSYFPDATAQSFQRIAQVDQCAWLLCKIWQELEKQLQRPASARSLSWLSLAKLACLVSPEIEKAQAQLEDLKYSRAEIRAAIVALKHLDSLAKIGTSPLSLREQYFLFQEVGNVFPMLTVLAAAVAAQKGVLQETRTVGAMAPSINRYLDPEDQVAHPTPLVTGNDLMRSLQLSPSPLIGKLLVDLQIARIEGRISSAEEALELAATWLNSA